MIKASELRIGNYVEDAFDIKNIRTIQIELNDFVAMANYNNSSHPNFYKPILITPKWLERMGFQRSKPPSPYPYFYIEDFDIAIAKEGFELLGSEWPMGKSFKYVHQLQNLYFALTGEELEIKQTV